MGLFDGLASALNTVFGAPVTINFAAGGTSTLQGVFRENPVDVTMADGRPQVVEVPTLRLRKDQAPILVEGDRIWPSVAAGRAFLVLRKASSGSPATDALITYELEEVL